MTHHSRGSARVSNGTIRVARMIPRTKDPPRNLMRASEKAAIELTMSPSTTVTTVMRIELIMNWANGTRLKTPDVVVQGQVTDGQERLGAAEVGEDLGVGLEAGDDHEHQGQAEHQTQDRPQEDAQGDAGPAGALVGALGCGGRRLGDVGHGGHGQAFSRVR